MLCDRLICGIKDTKVQRRLLAELAVTFKKAFELAQASEISDRDTKDLQVLPISSAHAGKFRQNTYKVIVGCQ